MQMSEPHAFNWKLVPYTLELLRQEIVACREIEREVRELRRVARAIDNEVKKLRKTDAGDRSTVRPRQEAVLDRIVVGRVVLELAINDRALRYRIRDMIGCIGRVGTAVAAGVACPVTIALNEGRYIGYFWHHWQPYIRNRRNLGEGRLRVFAPAEQLVCVVAEALSKRGGYPAEIEARHRDADRAYWTGLAESASTIQYFYAPRAPKD